MKGDREVYKEILINLFVDKFLTESSIVAAQVLVQAQEASPLWLRALANGNPDQVKTLWKDVVEIICYDQLEQLGFHVKLEPKEWDHD